MAVVFWSRSPGTEYYRVLSTVSFVLSLANITSTENLGTHQVFVTRAYEESMS